jgi:hypothetical protein
VGRLNDLGVRGGEVVLLDPRKIIIRAGFNYRDVESPVAKAHIDWLKANIKDRGVQQPARVEYVGEKVFLVDGQCRVEACKQLWKEGVKVPYKGGGDGPPMVPVITVRGDEAEMLAASMVANGALPPSQLEFGAAAARLLALGWDEDRVAKYTPPHIAVDAQKSRRYVRDAVELHQAPLAVKKAVKEGVDGVEVSAGLALHVTRRNPLHAEEEIKAEVEKAKANGKKVARRPKTAGKATKAKEAALTRTQQLEKIGDGMADNILKGEDGKYPPSLVGAARAWNQLRGRS